VLIIVFECTFIALACCEVLVDTLALSDIVIKLTFIDVSIRLKVPPKARFPALLELPFVDVSIVIEVGTFAPHGAVFELSGINVLIGTKQDAFTMLLVFRVDLANIPGVVLVQFILTSFPQL
jgi:hypothetical protein